MHLEWLDTTLRDGQQGGGISFTNADKREIIRLIDTLGIHLIEVGNPYSNEKDKLLLGEPDPHCPKKIVAFGSTRRKDEQAETSCALKALIDSAAPTVAIFGKASLSQVKKVLQTTADENIKMIFDSVSLLKKSGKRVIFDAEHFFDGYHDNASYAIRAVVAAADAGADTVVLCDTNGGAYPEDVADALNAVKTATSAAIGIHTHNDRGLAVANSLSAVRAGATHIQGTLLGYGERCGNAMLSTLLPSLVLHYGYNPELKDNLLRLTEICRAIAETMNLTVADNSPFIGAQAFAHKGGMHADGIMKDQGSFEHLSPDAVGNARKLLISEMSGRSLLLAKLAPMFPQLEKDSPELLKIVHALKEKENEGYQYEGAEHSFYLLASQLLYEDKHWFRLQNFHISEEATEFSKISAATVTISAADKLKTAQATSESGPVDALDIATREALGYFYPILNEVSLIDYKVRVINPKAATGANVRVLITSKRGKQVITTVGVSEDILKASFEALVDSYKYILTFGDN